MFTRETLVTLAEDLTGTSCAGRVETWVAWRVGGTRGSMRMVVVGVVGGGGGGAVAGIAGGVAVGIEGLRVAGAGKAAFVCAVTGEE